MTDKLIRPVLFYLGQPQPLAILSEADRMVLQQYPTKIMMRIAIEILELDVSVILYIHPEIRQVAHFHTMEEQFLALGGDIIETADDWNFETLILERRVRTCVIVHGFWAMPIQTICRASNVGVLLLEAPAFERDDLVFADPMGVVAFSTLDSFRPTGHRPPDFNETLERLRQMNQMATPHQEPYILVLLDRTDAAYSYVPFDPRHTNPWAAIHDIRAQFPNHHLAIRAHPDDLGYGPLELPDGCFIAGPEASLEGWVQNAQFVFGYASKSLFTALLFRRPVITLARGLTNFFNRSNVMIEGRRLDHLSERNILAGFSPEAADEFIYHVVTQHHLRITGDRDKRVLQNRRGRLYRRLLLGEPS